MINPNQLRDRQIVKLQINDELLNAMYLDSPKERKLAGDLATFSDVFIVERGSVQEARVVERMWIPRSAIALKEGVLEVADVNISISYYHERSSLEPMRKRFAEYHQILHSGVHS